MSNSCLDTVKPLQVNILFGPPKDKKDDDKMMLAFFSSEGKHIISGGTSARIASKYLKKPLSVELCYEDKDIPPIAVLSGADLVTEGIITMRKVLFYAKKYVENKSDEIDFLSQKDGASLICRMIFEENCTVNFFVGLAVNEATYDICAADDKVLLVKELCKCLMKKGIKTKISYF